MGLQTLQAMMMLAAGSSLLLLIGICLPFHTVSFFTGGLFMVGQVKLLPWLAQADFTGGLFCSAIRAANKDSDFCREAAGSHDLMDMQQRFCVDTIQLVFRGACQGFSNAYACGYGLMIACVVNIACQGVSCWMLYTYMNRSPKRQYRETAMKLCVSGASLVIIMLGVYVPLVSLPLDNINVHLKIIISTSKGTGVSVGFWIASLAMIIQGIELVLFKGAVLSSERRLMELKMQAQFEAEMNDGIELAGGLTGGGPESFTGGFAQQPQHAQMQGYPASGYGMQPGGMMPPNGGQFAGMPLTPDSQLPPNQMPGLAFDNHAGRYVDHNTHGQPAAGGYGGAPMHGY